MGRTVSFCARALAVMCFGESVALAQVAPPEPASAEASRTRVRNPRHRQRPPAQPWRKRAHKTKKTVEPSPGRVGSGWGFVLSAERLTSALHFEVASSTPGTGSVSATELSFLGGGSTSGLNPFALPRVAFDARYGAFTFGGSIVYGTTSNDGGDASMFLLSPRLGAFWPKAGPIRVWLRGGLSYVTAASDVVASTIEGERSVIGEVQLSYLDLTLEPLLTLMPTEHVGITFGPSLDFPLTGSGSLEYSQIFGQGREDIEDVHASSYGVAAGLVVVF